jgi:hypothetical protein
MNRFLPHPIDSEERQARWEVQISRLPIDWQPHDLSLALELCGLNVDSCRNWEDLTALAWRHGLIVPLMMQ